MSDALFYAGLFIIPILFLIALLFVAYRLFKHCLLPWLRVLFNLFRFPPKPPSHWSELLQYSPGSRWHWTTWLTAIALAYLLFPALYTDFAVAGATIRANHDLIAINAWNRSLFWSVLFAVNLPLIFLLRFGINRRNRWLGLSWFLWKTLFITFICATVFRIFAYSPWQSPFFSTVWFWWRDMAIHMDAYNAQTTAALAQSTEIHEVIWMKDLCCMVLAFLPFLLFYRASWPLQAGSH